MALAPGVRLGVYEILAPIGAGGMGQVFRARDSKLNRDVALKVLPDTFADDADRIGRFTREAQTLAALNHPHIAAIYGLEDGFSGQRPVRALVMELVEGEDLSHRIARGPIPIDQALAIALQIVEALEAAHDQGIIHRDLKPANIKVRADGTVKVLDFGLAKASEPALPASSNPSMSPTITTPAMTRIGMIMGTAAYMSPEQARGRAIDKRTDIWAFGAVLYEMLTSARAFSGDDVSSALASVIKDDVDWARLPAETPSGVRRLLRACLEKDVARRLQAIGDARLLLDDRGQPDHGVRRPAPRTARAWMMACALLAVVVGVLLAQRIGQRGVSPPPAQSVTFSVAPPPGMWFQGAAISPDGRRIALVLADRQGRLSMWMRRLDSPELRPLGPSDRGLEFQSGPVGGGGRPFWSPDERFVGVITSTGVVKVDVERGSSQSLYSGTPPTGAVWLRDGSIVFSQNLGGLSRLRAGASAPETVTTLDAARMETRHYFPAMLPDDRHVLYLVTSPRADVQGIWVASLDDPADRKRLLDVQSMALYSSGHLFFVRGSTLMAQPFDVESLTLRGEAVAVFTRVLHSMNTGFGGFTVSRSGTVVAMPMPKPWRLTWFDRAGRAQGALGRGGEYQSVALSPDEKRVAVDADTEASPGYRIFIVDQARDITTQLTVGDATGNFPAWSPDGKQLAFASNRQGVYNIYLVPSTGAGQESLLLKSPVNKFLSDWSRDGRFLIYGEPHSGTGHVDLWTLPMGGEPAPARYLHGSKDLREARFSPDGRWVAYQSDESSRFEIYVQAFPAGSDKIQISTTGGTRPRWRPDGRELYYLTPSGVLMAVAVTPGASFEAGAPQPLFQTWLSGFLRGYGISANGSRFLMQAPESESDADPVTVILDWPSLSNKN